MINKKIPLIPQNNREFFKFFINKNKYFIDIQFNHKSKINIKNLFLILKFFCINEQLLIEAVYVNSSEIENHSGDVFNLNLFHYIDIKKLKKFTFFEFKEWFDDIKENDHEYVKSLKYYGFRIVFNKNSKSWETGEIYPKYPWPKDFKLIYFNKNHNIESWLFLKNKELYKKWMLLSRIKK